jgi:signal transduction protein with GAF and PtsI domain
MAPMITILEEVRSFAQVAHSVDLPIIGVMIETPAAALQAEQILAEVDFVSIGTNDLAQYTFAADRQSAPLASLNNPWQPALLRMIEMVTRAATVSGKPVGVCGEAAADPLLALVVTGCPWRPEHSRGLATVSRRSPSSNADGRREQHASQTRPLPPERPLARFSMPSRTYGQ